jgi:plastocyanin
VTRYLAALLCTFAGFTACAALAVADVVGRVVDADGKGIADAVVFVHDPAAPAAAADRTRRATMDQIDKTFVPGVLPVAVGSEVRFPNHDQIHHHVYSFSRTKSFELPLYKGQDSDPVVFDKAGVVKVGCNIHDWMSAVILVLPTTHFAVTDANGVFKLTELPAGSYALAAWHELSRAKVDETAQVVRVGADGAPALAQDLVFKLDLAPARARPAMRGLRRDP